MAIDNWTKYSLIEPEVELTCGKNMAEVPPIVLPGLSEMVIFEKGVRYYISQIALVAIDTESQYFAFFFAVLVKKTRSIKRRFSGFA